MWDASIICGDLAITDYYHPSFSPPATRRAIHVISPSTLCCCCYNPLPYGSSLPHLISSHSSHPLATIDKDEHRELVCERRRNSIKSVQRPTQTKTPFLSHLLGRNGGEKKANEKRL